MRIIKITLATTLGLAFLLSLGCHFLSIWEMPASHLLINFPLLFSSGFVISFFIIHKIIWPNLINTTHRIQAIWILTSLIGGLFLILVIPSRITDIPIDRTLKMVATGQKNVMSEGSETWLNSIMTGNEVFSTHLRDICHGDWVQEEKHLISLHGQPAELVCSVRTAHDISIRFRTTPRSGKVELIYDDQIEEYDLYSEKAAIKTINLDSASTPKQMVIKYAVLLSDWLWLSLFLLTTSIWFITHTSSQSVIPEKRPLSWFYYSLPIMLVWSMYLLAFWPGSMTTDSLGQWQEIISGQFSDYHPAFHTLMIWLITRLWFSPAMVALLQILALSGVIGWGMSLIRRWEAPDWLVWSVVAVMAISPVNGMMIVTLWKDIPYSIAIVALILLILSIVNSDGIWIEKRATWIILGLVAALTSLFRHNGPVAAFGTLICLLLVFRNQRMRLLEALILTVGIWWVIRGPVYQLVGVTKSQRTFFFGASSLYLIDRHLAFGTPLSGGEREFLSRVRPMEPSWPYNCYTFDDLLFDGNLNTVFLTSHLAKTAQIAFNLTLRNPKETINHFICSSAFILQMTQPPKSFYEFAPGGIYENPFGLKSESKLPELKSFIIDAMKKTASREWSWLVWRTAFWMYLLIFGSIIASVRTKSWKYLLIPIPILLNSFSLSISSGGQAFRYVYSTMLASILLSGYLLLIPSERLE